MTTSPLDPYAVLGVSPGAPTAEVREAYRQRMLALHPDRGGADDATAHAEMAAVTRAWRQLNGDPMHELGGGPFTDPTPHDAAGAEPQPESTGEVPMSAGGPAPTLLRRMLTVTVVLLLAWMAVFVVIAFSQSG